MSGPSVVSAPGDSLPKALAAWTLDLLQAVLIRDPLLPPFSMRRLVGQSKWELNGDDFKKHGCHFVEKLVQDAGLESASRVLDLGCGCGRLAVPLTKVIGPSGGYVGLESIEPLVRWCRRSITSRFPHFQFIQAEVQNAVYNRRGKLQAETFRFPFEAGEFDLVAALSIFTHLLPRAAENYAAESARVLKRGGRLFATFYLIEEQTRSVHSSLDFSHELQPGVLTIDPALPERAVAHRTDWLLQVFQRHGLGLVPPVRGGGWTGRQPAYSWWQDVLILEKQR